MLKHLNRLAAAVCLLWSLNGCGDGSARWHTVTQELNQSVLSVWGSSDENVYICGGGVGVDGVAALVSHYDGSDWTELTTGHEETLWWVWGDETGSHVWFVGDHGLVLRWDGTSFEEMVTGIDATLFGVWGSSSDDVWIVGGNPGRGDEAPNSVVLHWNGSSLNRVDSVPSTGVAFFKVWGTSGREVGDVWITGEGGTLWHVRDGQWTSHQENLGTTNNLFSVHGCSSTEIYVAGGQALFVYDGTSWNGVEGIGLVSGANGVACGADSVLVVGNGGLKLRYERATDTWNNEQMMEPWDTDFHAPWVSNTGALWSVGGNFLAPASVGERLGVVGFWGTNPPASL